MTPPNPTTPQLSKDVEERFDKEFVSKIDDHVQWLKRGVLPQEVKSFLAQELENQKKRMVKRLNKLKVHHLYSPRSFGDGDAVDVAPGYNQAIDQAIQIIQKEEEFT